MDAGDLRLGVLVEYLHADDDELQLGHPGRVSDPSEEDVFVDWVGLEDGSISRHTCFGLSALGILDEEAFTTRSARVLQGLPPLA